MDRIGVGTSDQKIRAYPDRRFGINYVCRLSLNEAMETINIHEAKTNLSRLLSRVELLWLC